MPDRLREKYGLGMGGDGQSEYFHVIISYGFRMPVTFVRYKCEATKDELRKLSPSTAVVFIREYLKEKLEYNEIVEFQCIGPSPFHADVFLDKRPSESENIDVEDLSKPGDGYSTIYFGVPAEKDENVIQEFISAYSNILGTFYTVEVYRNRLIRHNSNAMDGVRTLFAESTRGFGTAVRRIKHGKTIDAILESLLEEQITRVQLDELVAEDLRDGEFKTDNIFFEFIGRAKDDVSPLPSGEIRDVVKMTEDRRLRYFGNLATLGSGLIGGLIGAVVGSVLTMYFSSVPGQLDLAHPERPASEASEGVD